MAQSGLQEVIAILPVMVQAESLMTALESMFARCEWQAAEAGVAALHGAEPEAELRALGLGERTALRLRKPKAALAGIEPCLLVRR